MYLWVPLPGACLDMWRMWSQAYAKQWQSGEGYARGGVYQMVLLRGDKQLNCQKLPKGEDAKKCWSAKCSLTSAEMDRRGVRWQQPCNWTLYTVEEGTPGCKVLNMLKHNFLPFPGSTFLLGSTPLTGFISPFLTCVSLCLPRSWHCDSPLLSVIASVYCVPLQLSFSRLKFDPFIFLLWNVWHGGAQ